MSAFSAFLIVLTATALAPRAVNALVVQPVPRSTKPVLPSPSDFANQNGSRWSLEYVGDIKFTQTMQSEGLGGDKCRTGRIGGKQLWNCGDMECGGSWTTCGFSMGPAFYGTDNVLLIDTDNITNVDANTFVEPWSGDEAPVAPQTGWGMDTSNIAPINDTHGVAYFWEIWRGAPDGSIANRGPGVASVTLGETKPIATRVGPLLAGGDAIQLGLLSILNADGYIYIYTYGGPSKLIVGRVLANDDVFDAGNYEFLRSSDHSTWDVPGSIPTTTSTEYGMQTASGTFGCSVYGSVFFSDYLGLYVLLCNIYLSFTNMYTSPTPYGPWSEEYSIMELGGSYGSMAHPHWGTNPLYFSLGPNGPFQMYKLTFNY